MLLNIQKFAEDPKPDENETNPKPDENKVEITFDEKQQAYIDRLIGERVKDIKTKAEKEKAEEMAKVQKELERKAELEKITDDKDRKLKEYELELEKAREIEEEFKKREIDYAINDAIASSDIPKKYARFLKGTSLEETQENIKEFNKIYTNDIQTKAQEIINGKKNPEIKNDPNNDDDKKEKSIEEIMAEKGLKPLNK